MHKQKKKNVIRIKNNEELEAEISFVVQSNRLSTPDTRHSKW